jgi:hypothetical protein
MNEDELLDALVQNHAVGQKQFTGLRICRDNLSIDVDTRDRPNPKNWQTLPLRAKLKAAWRGRS